MKPTKEDIRKEPLISKIRDIKVADSSAYRSGIFITGANSFVGIHLVKLLGEKWNGPVHLLVRAEDKNAAVRRMQDAFNFAELGEFKDALYVIHTGDVCKPHMGLQNEAYNEVRKTCGYVVHLAMNPVYHYPYRHFRDIWLPELEHMLSFCCDPEYPKSLHYPSSYNAGFFTDDEDFENLNANAWQSGYAGFKWVANHIISNAFRQGMSGCIYDIPLVLGSEEKGICPANYSIWHILEIFLVSGTYIDFTFRIIPVDKLAEIILDNLLKEKSGEEGSQFIRPVLEEPVTEDLFKHTAVRLLGLSHTTREQLRDSCIHKRKFDFLIPGNFYYLLDKVNQLKAVWPPEYNKSLLPSTYNVFYSNLMKVIQRQKIPSH
ncbi:SDR family oxidoreductase [Saccharicrinis sp. FJH2]|uniref:SDR family oxidoreductase n=1 Tax=Saccharicrinis sp. FJH65 TaxID=3344659 RepID=UPI0035F3F67F